VTFCDSEHHCITCGDDGVPMRVLRVDARQLATCLDDDGSHHTVDVELVDDVGPGDNVLVHAGVALARLAEGAFA
jgi:hydrogenase assembly chaperone HypC/HupF